jgi:hypothetical protein
VGKATTRITWSLIAALLAGCSAPLNVDNKHLGQHPVVSWIAVEDINDFCYALIGLRRPACSIWTKSGKRCVIFTGRQTDEQMVGHESVHCFKGDFHE